MMPDYRETLIERESGRRYVELSDDDLARIVIARVNGYKIYGNGTRYPSSGQAMDALWYLTDRLPKTVRAGDLVNGMLDLYKHGGKMLDRDDFKPLYDAIEALVSARE